MKPCLVVLDQVGMFPGSPGRYVPRQPREACLLAGICSPQMLSPRIGISDQISFPRMVCFALNSKERYSMSLRLLDLFLSKTTHAKLQHSVPPPSIPNSTLNWPKLYTALPCCIHATHSYICCSTYTEIDSHTHKFAILGGQGITTWFILATTVMQKWVWLIIGFGILGHKPCSFTVCLWPICVLLTSTSLVNAINSRTLKEQANE